MVVMVIGGNGQLGAACARELKARGVEVRASVRSRERGRPLQAEGIEVVELDITHGRERVRAALEGVEGVVVSANAVAPRAGDDPVAFDAAMSALVEDAVGGAVARVVLPSVPVSPIDDRVPLIARRRELERLVLASQAGWVLRFPPFMESWLALVGSSIPLRGEQYPTIGRPSPFLQRFRSVTGHLVEHRGVMLVSGSPSRRNAFISVRDAARACAEAATTPRPAPGPVEVAGPEILTWSEVADTFSRVLCRGVRPLPSPAAVYLAAAKALAAAQAEVPSRTMALNAFMAESETPWTTPGGGLVHPSSLLTVEEFLRDKAALPEQAAA